MAAPHPHSTSLLLNAPAVLRLIKTRSHPYHPITISPTSPAPRGCRFLCRPPSPTKQTPPSSLLPAYEPLGSFAIVLFELAEELAMGSRTHACEHARELATALSEILVRVGGVGVALEVLAVDERLDTPLDHLRVRFEEGKLAEYLRQQLLVRELLARLHNAHHCSLDRHRPVLLHALRVVRLVEVRHRNSDLEHLRLKLRGRDEGVGNLDRVRLGRLFDHFVLATREGVQHALQMLLRKIQALLELLEREVLVRAARVVEREDRDSLKGRHLQVVLLLSPVPLD
mmetsp:Transcript_17376/g.31661  ORF Transcript_17376/g.31661 Transcript_17376/m.31661 type:complete len:285 (-) Transcript_17376:1930-2784(-)